MNKIQQQKYSELCQELGHLHNNLRRVTERIKELELEIDVLDKSIDMQKILEFKQKAQGPSDA